MPCVDLETSHETVGPAVREVPPLVAPPSPALHEPLPPGSPKQAGRKFAKGNKGRVLRQIRERQLRERAQGLSTLDPAKAPSWLRPYIEMGASYTGALLVMLEGKPQLHALAGDLADAHVVYRGLLGLALVAEGRERIALLNEARGWLREHRSSLCALSALLGDIELPRPGDPVEAMRARILGPNGGAP